MTTAGPELQRELERIAERVPAYDVLAGAVARHRRRRTIKISVGSVVAVVAVLLGAVAAPGVLRTDAAPRPAAPRHEPSLPQRVDTPWRWTPSPEDSPAGPAALIFSGSSSLVGGLSEGRVAVVGAERDTYRLVRPRHGTIRDDRALVAPDGTRIAYTTTEHDSPIYVLDLRTGRTHALHRPRGLVDHEPLAWSPDGRTLAALQRTGVGNTPAWIQLVDVDSLDHGRWRAAFRISDMVQGRPTVAFSPDGTQIAYQSVGPIQVATVTGRMIESHAFPTTYQLAGTGAWTPDGRHLAVVERTQCCRDGNQFRARLELFTARDFTHVAGQEFPELPGVTAVRLLGWRRNGDAVLVASYSRPEPASAAATNTGPITVLALRRGGEPQVLLAPPREVHGIDISTAVVTGGRTRPGGSAPIWPMDLGWGAVAILWVVVMLVSKTVAIAAFFLRRRRLHPGQQGG
jgi:hypothetical protein